MKALICICRYFNINSMNIEMLILELVKSGVQVYAFLYVHEKYNKKTPRLGGRDV